MTRTHRLLWLTITLQTSTITALLAAILAHASTHRLPEAVTAAAAFAGTEGLLLAIVGFALAPMASGGAADAVSRPPARGCA